MIAYEIRDAAGNLAAVHERHDDPDGSKRFTWRDPDGSPGLNGTPAADLPLYGIDKLGAESRVVIVEGEKSADALTSVGIPAVATVTGAASTPGRAALAELTGRSVVVWADADEPGREHMRRTVAGLEKVGAGSVAWIDWPDAPPHGDVVDFLAAGGTRDDVMALIRDAHVLPIMASRAEPLDPMPSTASHSERPWPQPRSTVDPVIATVDPWLIDNLLRPGRLMVLAAAEGEGKSYARTETCIRLTTGHGALFNHYRIPRQRRVVSFEVENGEEEETRREEEVLARLGLSRAQLTDYWAVSLEGLSLTDPTDQAYIREAIARSTPDVAFFDTGSSMVGDEWGAELKAAIRFLRRLAREFGCAVVVLVHLVKPAKTPSGGRGQRKSAAGGQHGTALADVMGQWTRQADTVALMAPAGAERILWTVRKRAPHSQLVLHAEGGTFDVLQVVAGDDLGVGTMERIHGCIATGYADAASIAEYLKVTERTVFRHVKALREAGRLAPDGPFRVSVHVSPDVSPESERG